ncbi:MAG: hypothetical protein GY928_17070 [Colwellia sp.]|nr:hypothetical protein [Colwellia sp.]
MHKTRTKGVTAVIDYGEYLVGFSWAVAVGNKLLSAHIKFKTKPTDRQLRRLKKAWLYEMREYDYLSLHKKRYSIKLSKFIN